MVRSRPPAVTSEASCVLFPAASPVAIELTLLSTAKPPMAPLARLLPPSGDELLVGIDVVTMAVGEGPVGGQRLTQGQEHHAGRAGQRGR